MMTNILPWRKNSHCPNFLCANFWKDKASEACFCFLGVFKILYINLFYTVPVFQNGVNVQISTQWSCNVKFPPPTPGYISVTLPTCAYPSCDFYFIYLKCKLAGKGTIMNKLDSEEKFISSSTAIRRSHLENQHSLSSKEICTSLNFRRHWFVHLTLFSVQWSQKMMANHMI